MIVGIERRAPSRARMSIGGKMRLIHRHRSHRPKAPRILFTEEEIAADLHYPAGRRRRGIVAASATADKR